MLLNDRQSGGWRIALAFTLTAVAIAGLPSQADAAGNTYNWLNCHGLNREGNPGDGSVGLGQNGPYSAQDKCTNGIADWAYQLKNTDRAGTGTQALLQFNAPAGTAIRYFSMRIDARSADDYNADIGVIDFAGAGTTIYRAPNEPGGFVPFVRGDLAHRSIVVNLYCRKPSGCSRSDAAHIFVREVEIQLTDVADPSISSLGGDLLSGGWRRGTQNLSASAADSGSGLLVFGAQVNGTGVGTADGPSCPHDLSRPYVRRAVPCFSGTSVFNAELDTTAEPFRNGENKVSFFAWDYPINGSLVERTVLVDNAPPELWFSNSEDPEDPELIRARVADAHSGLSERPRMLMRRVGTEAWQELDTERAGSDLTARVNSAALPAGDYEFRLEAVDVAGNAAASAQRQNGQAMVLRFPLKGATTLESSFASGGEAQQTLAYGEASRVEGRLLDAEGKPLAGKRIVVTQEMQAGALYPDRKGDDLTDENGRFSTQIPPGPSGIVTAAYEGSPKYLASSDETGRITVKSAAAFRAVRKRVPEGKAVRFRGTVRHLDAEIPRGGKQVEVQVRLGSRWDTVKQAFRTKPDGRYRFRYRFGRHYTQDARFKFRLKVPGEGDWPYAGIATKPRKVTVEAN